MKPTIVDLGTHHFQTYSSCDEDQLARAIICCAHIHGNAGIPQLGSSASACFNRAQQSISQAMIRGVLNAIDAGTECHRNPPNIFQPPSYSYHNMASAWKVQINPEASPQGPFQVRPLRADSTEKASELLQRNHDSYHIYIHNIGLHSSIFSPLKFFIADNTLIRSHPSSYPGLVGAEWHCGPALQRLQSRSC